MALLQLCMTNRGYVTVSVCRLYLPRLIFAEFWYGCNADSGGVGPQIVSPGGSGAYRCVFAIVYRIAGGVAAEIDRSDRLFAAGAGKADSSGTGTAVLSGRGGR